MPPCICTLKSAITVQYVNPVPSQAGHGLTHQGSWAGPPEPSVIRGWMRITEGGGSTTSDGVARDGAVLNSFIIAVL